MKTFLRLSFTRKIAVTRILARVFVHLPSFYFQILDLIYLTVLIFYFDLFWMAWHWKPAISNVTKQMAKEIFAKICWQLKTPTRTRKYTRCIMQMSYLYASDFLSKTFANSLNMHRQYENKKNVWEKSNDAYSFSIREQTTKNHISIFTFSCFYHNINVKEVLLFQRASWERYCATYWRKQRFCNFWSFWACACKLSWTLFSPTRVQPL